MKWKTFITSGDYSNTVSSCATVSMCKCSDNPVELLKNNLEDIYNSY